MAHIRVMSCCGVKEIDELHCYTALTSMKNIAMGVLNHCAFVIFTGVVEGVVEIGGTTRYGQDFATYITKNGLGEVMVSPTRVNPNSLNRLAVWTWIVDHKALGAWIREHLKT